MSKSIYVCLKVLPVFYVRFINMIINGQIFIIPEKVMTPSHAAINVFFVSRLIPMRGIYTSTREKCMPTTYHAVTNVIFVRRLFSSSPICKNIKNKNIPQHTATSAPNVRSLLRKGID